MSAAAFIANRPGSGLVAPAGRSRHSGVNQSRGNSDFGGNGAHSPSAGRNCGQSNSGGPQSGDGAQGPSLSSVIEVAAARLQSAVLSSGPLTGCVPQQLLIDSQSTGVTVDTVAETGRMYLQVSGSRVQQNNDWMKVSLKICASFVSTYSFSAASNRFAAATAAGCWPTSPLLSPTCPSRSSRAP